MHSQLSDSRLELTEAKQEVQTLEAQLLEQQTAWQTAAVENAAEIAGLREREEKLRRRLNSLVDTFSVNKAAHAEAVERYEKNIRDLEERTGGAAEVVAEGQRRAEAKERELEVGGAAEVVAEGRR